MKSFTNFDAHNAFTTSVSGIGTAIIEFPLFSRKCHVIEITGHRRGKLKVIGRQWGFDSIKGTAFCNSKKRPKIGAVFEGPELLKKNQREKFIIVKVLKHIPGLGYGVDFRQMLNAIHP